MKEELQGILVIAGVVLGIFLLTWATMEDQKRRDYNRYADISNDCNYSNEPIEPMEHVKVGEAVEGTIVFMGLMGIIVCYTIFPPFRRVCNVIILFMCAFFVMGRLSRKR